MYCPCIVFVLSLNCESRLLDQFFVLSCIVFLYVKFFLERVFFSDVGIVHVNIIVRFIKMIKLNV